MRSSLRKAYYRANYKFPLGGWLNSSYLTFRDGVLADGGEIDSQSDLNSYITMAKANGIYDSIQFGMLGAYNIRTSGNTKYVTKAYSMDATPNDATQTTESLQPYLSGVIAPNEKWGIKNPTGDSRLLSIPSITITGTITRVEATDVTGKVNITHTDVVSQNITSLIPDIFTGAYFVRNETLSAAQKAAEATKLRQIFPEIPSVQIGTQRWATSNFEAVATPMGNVIQEMQQNVAVEKVVNGGFDTDVSGWTGTTGTVYERNTINPISGTGDLKVSVSGAGGWEGTVSPMPAISPTIGKWYKLSFDYRLSTSSMYITLGFYNYSGAITQVIVNNLNSTTNKHVEIYVKATTMQALRIMPPYNNSTVFEYYIDNFSFQELGWADSQDLYDGLIAQGSTEQEALEASAMWCYYNNDPSLGAIYGKLYNWFAVKLLQNDIDAYNIANPSTPWGWHVPSESEFDTLATALGGASVAGGKMKVAGNTYFLPPNDGDNSSGFSAIGSGYRGNATGNFSSLNSQSRFHVADSTSDRFLLYNSSALGVSGSDGSVYGASIHLIQD